MQQLETPASTQSASPTTAETSGPVLPIGPLIGRWRHGNGYIICGTIRVARLDFDTAPASEFITELLDWLCERLNSHTNAAQIAAEATAHSAELMTGLRSALAQFDDFEPVPGDGLSSDEEDTRKHGAWLSRRADRRLACLAMLGKPSPGLEMLKELEQLRGDLERQIAGAAGMINAFEQLPPKYRGQFKRTLAAGIGVECIRISDCLPAPSDVDDEGHVYAWIPGVAASDLLPAVLGGWELRSLEDLAEATHWCRTGLKRPAPPAEANKTEAGA